MIAKSPTGFLLTIPVPTGRRSVPGAFEQCRCEFAPSLGHRWERAIVEEGGQ